jgi:peptide/nickel transport system permease protein
MMRGAASPVWLRLRRDRPALVASAVLLVLVVSTLAANPIERWLGVSGVDVDLLSRFAPPTAQHLLGADIVGRDELARLLRGGRTSLAIGFMGAMGTSAVGTLVGAVSGYARGRTDMLLMRFTDFVAAVPHLPILIILGALDLGKLGFSEEFIRSGAAAFWRVVVIVTLLGWTGVARLMRAGTMALAERDFVVAARACGAPKWRVLFVHIVPNAITPVLIHATTSFGAVILTESGLSFLDLGIQPPATSWGSMLSDAQTTIGTSPLLAILPGALILVTVTAVNALGDGLRAALDPRTASARP